MTKTLRIAVADDEPDMRNFLARMLPRCGHEVVSIAPSGEQLIADCRRHAPDLVITDVKMPGMDGIEASKHIYRERPTSVILVSAYHDAALVEQAHADHVAAYLVKPIVFADLQPAIAAAMQRFDEMQSRGRQGAELHEPKADCGEVEHE